ncbi:Na+:solute symporter [Stakelama sediminis]|uniref:Na+/proline symporter n=1 Tax=Stakelama sediminis TaxID=463200 RepID=A0A840Z0D3_9SPHN|nr:sodium:solute symporter family protein [Stakelama sediminis]MBB5719182.1 Na+/proline symporter [Stakelama sediminis]
MQLQPLDWIIMLSVIAIGIILGLLPSKAAGESAESYFLSGRTMKWWLLGTSMVATTFSTDTPNLVANLTRTSGAAGNWAWWAFLLTSMTTTFFFSHLWRRSGVSTDVEFYEMRYSGRVASALRIFRGLYIGVLINVIITAAVTLAAIKFGAVLLGLTPVQTVVVACAATGLFAMAGGLKGVLLSDFFLFFTAMIGAFAAAYFAVTLPQVGGIHALFARPEIHKASAILPSLHDHDAVIGLLIMPLLVQWWSVWYPGAEPGGGGYVAQRMLAAKDEKHAMGGMLLFNVAHYALRSWPWIVVALASMVVFPDLASLRRAFPNIDPHVIGDDMAYPAMLTFLPSGWLGLVAASLTAAYMSTAGTSLNLGSSYVVLDIYRRFMRPDAPEREYVLVGRIVTVVLMIIIALVALTLRNALQTFQILLSVGAGTGLLFLLRWYWPRISAWSELAAMTISFIVSIVLEFAAPNMDSALRLCLSVGITTVGWIAVTLLTPPTDEKVLQAFFDRVHPPGPGWRRYRDPEVGNAQRGQLGTAFFCTIAGCAMVYGILFSVGEALRGDTITAIWLGGAAAIAAVALFFGWKRIDFEADLPDEPEVLPVETTPHLAGAQ